MTAANSIRSLKINPYNNIRPKGPAAVENELLDRAAEMIKRALDNKNKSDKAKLNLDKLRDSYKKIKPGKRLTRPNSGRYGKKVIGPDQEMITKNLRRLLKIKPEKTVASTAIKNPIAALLAVLAAAADQRPLASGTLDDALKIYGGRR